MEDEEEIVDLDDIFEEYGAVPEENLNHDGQNEHGSNNPGNADNSEAFEAVAAPKKRVVKNPRLKFDPDRLCGPRGIPVLMDHFKDKKFKGKGHEVEDLDCLLSTLEHWTHRLFPSMKFVDTLKHIEKLGKKRPVQTCLQRIRLDMPILSSDFSKEDEEEPINTHTESFDLDEPSVSAFDRLLGDQQLVPESHETDDIPRTSQPVVLTDEQRLRIQRNKERAAEKLRARLAAMNSSLQGTDANETVTETLDIPNENVTETLDIPNENVTETLDIPNESESILSVGINNNVLGNDISPKSNNAPLSPEPYGKPAKRLRVLSDSEESCDLDALVESTMTDELDTDVNDPDSLKTSASFQPIAPIKHPKYEDKMHKDNDSVECDDEIHEHSNSLKNDEIHKHSDSLKNNEIHKHSDSLKNDEMHKHSDSLKNDDDDDDDETNIL